MITTKKEALQIIGGLSNSSKMPETAHGTPAKFCVTGSSLRERPGTTCYGCYALKGRCGMPKSVKAQERRLEAMQHPRWAEAMAFLLQDVKYHRWYDTGDLFCSADLMKIIEVCKLTPKTKHWLPTREVTMVHACKKHIPDNLVIRISMPMIGQIPTQSVTKWTSTVHWKGAYVHGRECPAKHNMNQCGDCRACWDKRVRNVSYEYH